MNEKDTNKHRARMDLRRLREIILDIDPGGLAGCPDDEYENQVFVVYKLLLSGNKNGNDIARALRFVNSDKEPSPREIESAQRVLEWWHGRQI